MVHGRERLEGTAAHALTAWGAPSIQATRRLARAAKDLPYQLHATLAHPLGHPAQLQPVLAAFSEAGSPRSVTAGSPGPAAGSCRAGRDSHRRQLTHALLDEQPQTPACTTCADMFRPGRRPPRTDEYTLCGSSPGFGEILAGPPRAARRSRAPLRDLARAAPRPARSCGAFTKCRRRVGPRPHLVALAFLAWLDDRGTTWDAAPRPTSIPGSTAHPLSLPAAGLPHLGQRPPPGRHVTVPALPRPSWPGSHRRQRWQRSAGACATGHPARRPDRRAHCCSKTASSSSRLTRSPPRHRAGTAPTRAAARCVPVLLLPQLATLSAPSSTRPRAPPATRAPPRSSPPAARRPVHPDPDPQASASTGSSPASP